MKYKVGNLYQIIDGNPFSDESNYLWILTEVKYTNVTKKPWVKIEHDRDVLIMSGEELDIKYINIEKLK